MPDVQELRETIQHLAEGILEMQRSLRPVLARRRRSAYLRVTRLFFVA